MVDCQKCGDKFPFFTIMDKKRPNPVGGGNLCKKCFQPYHLVLKKYTTNLEKTDTDPKSAAWIILCYLLAAKKVNLVRTLTAVLCGIVETKNSWEVCRQRSMELVKKARSILPSNSEGQIFLQQLQKRAEEITGSPSREIPIQIYGSVLGNTVTPIEYDAVSRSGISIDELYNFAKSLPSHQWLLSSKT